MTAPVVAPAVPVVLAGGRYLLGDVLGRGGMALTRRAEDRKLDRAVAIKTLPPDPDPEVAAAARSRFLREARAVARFDHPGIVRVYEVFEEDGAAHLVMELLAGRSLGAELTARRRPLELAEARSLAIGVGRALTLVHGTGLLHRDVSPSNIVLVAGRPLLVDFGLARELTGARPTDLVTRMVTPGFSPPEQYAGDGDRIGPPTDVYGLAATLYHALAGRLPASAIERASGTRLEPVRRLRPDLPRTLADGIHDGLELDPSHRPATMPAFVARLGLGSDAAVARDPVPVPELAPPAPPEPANRGQPIPDREIGCPQLPKGVEQEGPKGRPPAPSAPSVRTAIRWPALVPVAMVAAAVGWLLPLLGVVALALGAVPVAATVGDHLCGTVPARLPGRLARHVASAARGTVVPIGFATAAVVIAVLVDRLAPASAADDLVAGTAGAMAGFVVVAPAAGGPVADRWVERCTGRVLAGTWAAAGVVAVGALALHPDLLPFAG